MTNATAPQELAWIEGDGEDGLPILQSHAFDALVLNSKDLDSDDFLHIREQLLAHREDLA